MEQQPLGRRPQLGRRGTDPEWERGCKAHRWFGFQALPPPSCVTLGKSLYLSEPQFSNLPKEREKSTYSEYFR